MDVGFNFSIYGLKVKFTNLSEDLSSKVMYTWQFGDGSESHELDPCHIYKEIGQYRVILIARDATTNLELGSYNTLVMVSDFIKTKLSDTIYNLINTYIPETVFGKISFATKRQFIQKWQLYIHPLVNHFIPVEEYNNELYYEALENELIMELAAYDFMTNQLNLMVSAAAQTVKDNNEVDCVPSPNPDEILGGESSSCSSTTTVRSQGSVKKITTGPTEVEYFDGSTSDSDMLANASKAMQPGGIIDLIKQNICMLAERLEIYLPICSRLPSNRVVPKVVDKRYPGFLDGPDPIEVVK